MGSAKQLCCVFAWGNGLLMKGLLRSERRWFSITLNQARMQLNGTGTVLEEVSDGSETVLFGEQRLSARSYLRRFLFADERLNEPVHRLSGGERRAINAG